MYIKHNYFVHPCYIPKYTVLSMYVYNAMYTYSIYLYTIQDTQYTIHVKCKRYKYFVDICVKCIRYKYIVDGKP